MEKLERSISEYPIHHLLQIRQYWNGSITVGITVQHCLAYNFLHKTGRTPGRPDLQQDCNVC